MKKILLFSFVLTAGFVSAQEDSTVVVVEELEFEGPEKEELGNTFNSTRIINGHSVETLDKGILEFRIEHRFGDVAGTNGGVQNWFGFDNAADIRFGFEYGVTKNLMIGLGRSKGTGAPYRSLLDGFAKYRILRQEKNGMPISLSVLGVTTLTYMKASPDISKVEHFPEFAHRLAYATQINIAKKFGNRLSLSIMPTYVHRNYVAADDVNGLFSIGGAVKFGINRHWAIVVEYYQNIQSNDVRTTNKNSLGIAVEWVTFGHNFTFNFTNSKGFGETQFIPYTFEDWTKGQFRLGFTISRKFVLFEAPEGL